MNELDKVLSITDSEQVELAENFKKLLHTELTFGMTRYVCRYGTLADGHEKITDAQIYYQAIREAYSRAQTMRDHKCAALEAQANIIDAEDAIVMAMTKPEKLRAEAKMIRATSALQNALVMAEDCKRQMDEFLKVVNELQDKVRAMYPEGIEQAEPDNWKAVAEYRANLQDISRTNLHMEHLPLDKKTKAALGVKLNKPELTLWFAVEKQLQDRSPQGISTALRSELTLLKGDK